MLDKLLPPTAVAAQFGDESLELGITRLKDRTMYCVFNWSDSPADRTIPLAKPSTLKDYWSDKNLGTQDGQYKTQLPARSAMLVEATPA